MKILFAKFLKHIPFERIFIICLICSVLTKPIKILYCEITDCKFELYEETKKNGEAEEKEIGDDFEKEEYIPSYNNQEQITVTIDAFQNYQIPKAEIANTFISILVPPPKS